MAIVPYPAMEGILRHLEGDARAISRCALVSHDWTIPAQRALFSSRCFLVGSFTLPRHQTQLEPASRISSYSFDEMIEVSPRLVGYITRLVYRLYPKERRGGHMPIIDTMRPLVEIGLLSIVSLTLVSTHETVFALDRVDEQLVSSFRMLTELRLYDVLLADIATWRNLVRSFPSVTSLSIFDASWLMGAPRQVRQDEGLPLQLHALELVEQPFSDLLDPAECAAQLLSWLTSAVSTSSLRTLKIDSGWITDDVRTFLRGVHDLHLHLFTGYEGGEFPTIPLVSSDGVTALTVSTSNRTLSDICRLLHRTAFAAVRVLHLQWQDAPDLDSYDEEGWYQFVLGDPWVDNNGVREEPVIRKAQFPALQCIEVSFTFGEGVRHVWGVDKLRKVFPTWAAQGCIQFTDPEIRGHLEDASWQ